MIVSLQSSLGIQFRKGCLTLVYLKKFLREEVVAQHEVIPQPLNKTGENLETFWIQEICRFVKENNIGKENVWVGIPRHEMLFRFLSLPASAEENLRNVVRYEIEKYIPFSEEDVVFDFMITEKDVEVNTLQLLLLVTKKEVLEKYLSVLDRAGITPLGMETSSTSLLNTFLLGKNEKEKINCIGLVDIGKYDFEIEWIGSSRLRYLRSVDFQTEESSDRIQQIKENVENSFQIAFPSHSRQGKESENDSAVVYLMGEEKESKIIDGLVKTDQSNITMFPREIISARLDGQGPVSSNLISGIGLALKGIKKVPLDVNLLPKHLRKKTGKAGLCFSVILFIAIIILFLIWGVSSIVKERLVLNKIEKEIDSLKNEVFSIQKIRQDSQSISKEIKGLNDIQQSEFSRLMILKELSTVIPPSVWLTDLRCYKSELNLSGFAKSASDLIALLDSSPRFHSSEFIAPITRDRGGKERFKIKTKIERR